MTAIPDTFRAYVAERLDDRLERGIREFHEPDLPPGEVEIRVEWSSVNFKDGLATRFDGKVARLSPLIPGIDLAGRSSRARTPSIPVGASVLAHGYDLGVARHGGYAEYQRVPAGWVVPLHGLTPREAMAIGTAGFTAAMSVVALEERGLTPGDGPVLVTGASGGVGGMAVAILGRARLRGLGGDRQGGRDRPRLRELGATGFLTRDEVTVAGKPLDRRAGRVPSTPSARPRSRTCCGRSGPAAAVTASGNASGPKLDDHGPAVHPARRRDARHGFGAGADRAPPPDLGPAGDRPAAPRRSARTSPSRRSTRSKRALDAIVAGEARGRWVVRIA